eukprot:1196770-Prymnesium_polylepis.1
MCIRDRTHTQQTQPRTRHTTYTAESTTQDARLANCVRAPSQHAGEYIMMLRGEGEAALKAFLSHRTQQWNREPRQKIWRCVDHVCKYMAYMIEENARGGTKDLEITYEEMRSFFLQRKRGARIKSVLTSRLNDGAFAASL